MPVTVTAVEPHGGQLEAVECDHPSGVSVNVRMVGHVPLLEVFAADSSRPISAYGSWCSYDIITEPQPAGELAAGPPEPEFVGLVDDLCARLAKGLKDDIGFSAPEVLKAKIATRVTTFGNELFEALIEGDG